MTENQLQNYVKFINEELKHVELEKLFQITKKQWGHDKSQTIWWSWRCKFDNFDHHLNDFLIK